MSGPQRSEISRILKLADVLEKKNATTFFSLATKLKATSPTVLFLDIEQVLSIYVEELQVANYAEYNKKLHERHSIL